MINLVKEKFKGRLIKDIGAIFLSSSMVNVFNLIFWLYMVRHLAPTDYGIFNSLIGILIIVSLPAAIIQITITRFIAEFLTNQGWGKIKTLIIGFTKRMLYFSVLLSFLVIYLRHPLAKFLKLPDERPMVLLAFIIVFNMLYPLTLAALQGLEYFTKLAVNVVASGLAKLVLGILLVALGFNYFGALGGFLAGTVFGCLLSVFLIPKKLWQAEIDMREKFNFAPVYKYIFPVSIAMLAFSVLTNMDVILVKHYFSPEDSGYYSISQIVGKIILFLPGAVTTVMFPKVSGLNSMNKDTTVLLKKCLFLAAVLVISMASVIMVMPGVVLKLLTGKAYPVLIPLARLFVIAMGVYALVGILINYHLSIRNLRYILTCALFCVLQVIFIVIFHQDLKNILYILIFIASCLLILGLREVKKKPVYARS